MDIRQIVLAGSEAIRTACRLYAARTSTIIPRYKGAAPPQGYYNSKGP